MTHLPEEHLHYVVANNKEQVIARFLLLADAVRFIRHLNERYPNNVYTINEEA
jgi:hypothetical protein